MGTRHQQKVITKAGELKVNQYGQWDGYPEGQGLDILRFLRGSNLVKYQENLEALNRITEEQGQMVEDDEDWKINYPYLSRDCGSDIHKMIEDGVVKFVQFIDDDEAKSWCEGFYTIDFKRNLFIAEYHGFIKQYELNNLPSEEKFLKDFKD